MSRHSLKPRRSSMRMRSEIRKDREEELPNMKPFGFCCSIADYDLRSNYGQPRPPFKSAMTPIQKIHEAAVVRLYTETIDSAEAERRRKQARARLLLPQAKPEMIMPSSSTVAPIGYYLEDEIAQGRHSHWEERKNAYNAEADKNLAEGIKKTNNQMKKCSRMQCPKWYQDFSFEQMKNLACLERAVYEDYEEMVTGRTQRTLMAIGVLSTLFTLSAEVLRKLQKSCQQDVVDFLREIYKILTGNYFEDEGYKEVYDCNERIILTGIAFLTFPETVLELHRRLPPVTVPKLPPKPQPPEVLPRKRMPCPYEEELFMRPDWANYLNNLEAWKAYCKLVPIPKVILPDPSTLLKRKQLSKISIRETRRKPSKPQSAQVEESRQRSSTPPAPASKRSRSTTFEVEQIHEDNASNDSADIIAPPRLARRSSRRLSQVAVEEKLSEFVLDYDRYDIPRLPDENKVFNFTLNGLSEKSGPVEYKICGTMNPPQPHKKLWLGEKHAHYIISGAPNNPPTCPVTYEMTGVANITPVNSDERFFTVLKIGDGPRKIYPSGRQHLSQNWQEWLQNADEEYKKMERQANKMVKDIEATMRLVFPGPTCDSCCSCRQTRKTHTKWKETKAPYFVIDTVTEDENKNKYIVGSMAMHSPAPSPAESTVNLLEVIASEDVLATNLIINGVTNDKGETQYFITGSKKSWMHIPSRVVEPPPPLPLRNVPPCACAVHQIFNKGLTPRMSGDNIPWTKDEGKCYGKKFRPDETGAYSCRMHPGDKSCRRNPFMLDIEKLKRKQAKEKLKKEKPEYSDKDKKMYSIAEFKPCGDEHGDPVCSGPWGETNKWTRAELEEAEKERKAILKGPPCGQKPGRAVCEGPFGARVPMEKKHAKIEEVAYSKDMSPEELAALMAAEEEEEDEEEEEEEEEEELPPPKKERPKIRDKGCHMSPESIAGRTKVVKKKVHKFIPDPNYHGYDDLWNIYRTAPTEEEQVEPEYEGTLKLSSPEARPTSKKDGKKEGEPESSRSTSPQRKSGSVTRLQKEKGRKSGSIIKKLSGKKGSRKAAMKSTASRSTIHSVHSVESGQLSKRTISIGDRSTKASSERITKKSTTGTSIALPGKSSSAKLSRQTTRSQASKSATSARKSLQKRSAEKAKQAPDSRSSSKARPLTPRLGHTRIDRPSTRASRGRVKKVREAKLKSAMKPDQRQSRSPRGKLTKKRSVSAGTKSRHKSPSPPGKLMKKRSVSAGAKTSRRSPSPSGRLMQKRSVSAGGKFDRRSPGARAGRKSPSPRGRLTQKRSVSSSAERRSPTSKSGRKSARPLGKHTEKWSASGSFKQPGKKKESFGVKSRRAKEVSEKSSEKYLPRSKVPSYGSKDSKKGRKGKKGRKAKKESIVLTEEERKQERQRLKNLIKSADACPIKVEPAEIPEEPRKPCKHEFEDDQKSVTPVPSESPSEKNLPKKGPCGWLTKSEQKLPVKKNLIYLADKVEPVDTIPVRPGGKACTCREMRNKKKQLMYNIGGILDKETTDTQATKLLKKKKEEEEEKDTHLIEGAIYYTPPPSPRRSDEYVPEYGLFESPYDMCVTKRKDTNLRLIEQTAGPKGLTSNVMKMREPCGCTDYIDSYGLLDPESNTKAKELEEVDKTRKELIEGRSTEERWYRAFKDAGLVDYFSRCKHSLPCWLKCSKFNKHGCKLKYRKLQIRRPVCECKYERKVLEHREERVNWKKRQQRLKSLKKQPYMSIVETSRPVEVDTKLLISDVKRIPQDDEYIDDVKFCVTGVAENYNMLPPQQVVDGMKMMTPVQTPEESLVHIPINKGLHRHWSPVDLPPGPLPRKDAAIIADRKRRQEALEEAYREIYAPVETRDPHGTHTCQAACNPEPEESLENDSDADVEISKRISFMPGDVAGRASREKVTSVHKASRSESSPGGNFIGSDKPRSSKRGSSLQENRPRFGQERNLQDKRSIDKGKISISIEGQAIPKAGDDLMKSAEVELRRMAQDGFVFAKLPESFKVPQLQDWLLYRKGVVYTEQDKKNVMRDSIIMWNMMSTVAVPPIEPLPLDYSKKEIKSMTFANIEKLKKEITEKKALFHSNMRKARVAYAHSLWDSMEYRKFPTKTFKEAYFTYLASKECDGHVFKPWFLSEVRDKPRKA